MVIKRINNTKPQLNLTEQCRSSLYERIFLEATKISLYFTYSVTPLRKMLSERKIKTTHFPKPGQNAPDQRNLGEKVTREIHFS